MKIRFGGVFQGETVGINLLLVGSQLCVCVSPQCLLLELKSYDNVLCAQK